MHQAALSLNRCEEAREASDVSTPHREACATATEEKPKRLREEARAVAGRISAVIDAHVVTLDRRPTKLSRALRRKHALVSNELEGFGSLTDHLRELLKVHRLNTIDSVSPSLTAFSTR